jgi:C-terminal processing protease CtpA/Prc
MAMRARFTIAGLRRMAPTALLLLAAVPAVSQGQQRRVVVREASAFEQEVDRLVQELLQKKRTSLALLGNLQELQLALRTDAVPEQARGQAEASARQLRARLTALESDGARIQRRLNDICAADRKPEGWVGIYYSASASALREDDGRVVMRFVDYPGIESVEPGSPADKAGVRAGDRIMSMAGRDLRNAEIDFTPLLRPGTRIPFKVRRGMESKLLTVTVEPRPDGFSTPCPWIDERIAAAMSPMQMTVTVTTEDGVVAPNAGGQRIVLHRAGPTPASPPTVPSPVVAAAPPSPPLPPLPPMGNGMSASTIVFGGAQFVAVGPELAEALGVERGMLVVSAGRGSPADQSGLRAGDVLLSADGQTVSSPLVFLQAVEESSRREVRLQILRRRKPLTLTLKW